MTVFSYRNAGVDIDAGAALVDAIRPLAGSTARTGVMSGIGGFGALFDVAATGLKDPVLVASTDGVGTKLKVAIAVDKHDTVGIDLVAMCVNDLVVQGAEPLFFLDYFATGRLDIETASKVVSGIAEGCRQAGCALIGGETAEMPGMYGDGDYDLAGFAVGAVERDAILTGKTVSEGDAILGIASSGLHSNGFSLVRKVLAAKDLDYRAPAPFDRQASLGQALLVPTRIYVKSCLAAIRTGGVRALAHITGGGLLENIPRVLPSGLSAEIDATTWELPAVFRWLATAGALGPTETARTFNCGIGMAVIVAPRDVAGVAAALEHAGERVWTIGRVIGREEGVLPTALKGAEQAWPS